MTGDNVDDDDDKTEKEGDETGECVHREGEVVIIDGNVDDDDDNAEGDSDETGECGHREEKD